MILQFDRTMHFALHSLDEIETRDEAAAIARSLVRNDDVTRCSYESDYFQEVSDLCVPNALNFKCIGTPFFVDNVVADTHADRWNVCATQKCLFFANGITDADIAITMASVASAADDVEQKITIKKDASMDRLTVIGPEGVPESVLVKCFAQSVVANKRKKAYFFGATRTATGDRND